MTLHKLSAGSGYEYLTRQVAALDSTENGATPLADYYAAKGRRRADGSAPGWSALPGVAAGDVVTAEQMKHRRQLVRASGQDRGRGSEAAHSGAGDFGISPVSIAEIPHLVEGSAGRLC